MAGMTMTDPGASATMDRLLWAVDDLAIELPSWGFVNTGTRFRVWQQRGVPRTVEEKVDDAGTVRRYTGIARSMALHIPWDKADDYAALGDHIESRGLKVGAVNSNTFQDADYMLGSLCHPVGRGARQGRGGHHRVLPHRGHDGRPGASRCGSGTAPTTRARTTCAIVATASSRVSRQVYAAAARAAPACYLEYKLYEPAALLDRRPGLGPGAGRLPPRGRAGRRLRGYRPPLAGRQHRADRGAAAGGGPARRLRPQRQEVRRRRPDGRCHRPLPALPHHATSS